MKDDRIAALLRRYCLAASRTSEESDRLDEETIAAYVEGQLSENEREQCESVFAKGGISYQELLGVAALRDPSGLPSEKNARVAERPKSVFFKPILMRWGVAACLSFLLLGATVWKLTTDRTQLSRRVAALESDLWDQRFQTTEQIVNQSMHDSVIPFWLGEDSGLPREATNSSRSLRDSEPSVEQEQANRLLADLIEQNELSPTNWLRIAGLQIKVNRADQARTSLSQAKSLAESKE